MKSAYLNQAILAAPFGMVGIRCDDDSLTGIAFINPHNPTQTPLTPFALEVCKQLTAYFEDPTFHFDLPYKLNSSPHQGRVWQAMCAIPLGQTRQYGELAKELASSARAVGQACGANPLPIIIPCHRVVGKSGIGGFAHHRDGYALSIKHWLLKHEQR